MPSYKITDTALVARVAAATTGWTAFTSLQSVFDLARTQGLPVFLQPGVYANGPLTVLTSNGSGKPLRVAATPGTATIQFTGGGTPLKIENQSFVSFEGVNFDAQNLTLPDYVYGRPAFIAVKSAYDVTFEDCQVVNSKGLAFYVTGGQLRMQGCYVGSHSYGLFAEDARVFVRRNFFSNLTNNGVVIWRSSVTGDSSEIIGNSVNGVDTLDGGTGQNGNCILIFRAMGVTVSDNRLFNAKYSGVRVNGGGQAVIEGNSVWNARETGVFIEAPGVGIDSIGAVVSNNHIDTVAVGITVANAGLYNDGVARSVVIEGNRVANARVTSIPDAGYYPPQVGGVAIAAETDCVISGNIVESAEVMGVQIGNNDAVRDVSVTGNLVRGSKIGIGVSNYAITGAKGEVVVAGNIVRGATNGSIVPASGSSRYGTADYGSALSQVVGKVTFSANRASA